MTRDQVYYQPKTQETPVYKTFQNSDQAQLRITHQQPLTKDYHQDMVKNFEASPLRLHEGIHDLTDSLVFASDQSISRVLISLFQPAYNHYYIRIEFKLDRMSARLAFVEARNRLAAQQESDNANKEKKDKKVASLSKFLKGQILKSPLLKTSDGIAGSGARVAFQASQQERAAADARNAGGRHPPKMPSIPEEPDRRKMVEEWLNGLNENAGKEDGAAESASG